MNNAEHIFLNGEEIKDLVIPNSVTRINDGAFYGCHCLTSVTIPGSVTSIGYEAFSGCRGLKSVTIGNGVTNIGSSAFYYCSGLTSVVIPNSVTNIGQDAFFGCSGLKEVYCLAENVPHTNLSTFVFSSIENATLHVPAESIEQYKATEPWSGFGNILAIIEIDGIYYELDSNKGTAEIVKNPFGYSGVVTIPESVTYNDNTYTVTSIEENVLPKTVTINISVGKFLLWLWNNGYENIRETGTGRSLAAPEISLVAQTASSLTLSYKNDYPEFTETVIIQDEPIEKGENGYKVTLKGLEPENLYEDLASLTLTFDDASYTKAFSFRTEPLTLTTQQPKVVSLGNIVVVANSNLDDEEINVGFEWRRTDWTEDFLSKVGAAYLYEGTMEGYIRSLNTDKLWKYRPYYESNAGNRYYGKWVGIDPTDVSYFVPTVHTYSTINLLGNTAEVMGYAMRGTDNISSQGFMYWSTGSESSRRNANGIPSNAKTVLSSGNMMTATLENLDYDTEYCYLAFVTTSEGETFYGEPQTFRTGEGDPDGVREIKNEELKMKNEEGWYDLSGRKIDKPQKGINIIRYSDGSSKKVVIK